MPGAGVMLAFSPRVTWCRTAHSITGPLGFFQASRLPLLRWHSFIQAAWCNVSARVEVSHYTSSLPFSPNSWLLIKDCSLNQHVSSSNERSNKLYRLHHYNPNAAICSKRSHSLNIPATDELNGAAREEKREHSILNLCHSARITSLTSQGFIALLTSVYVIHSTNLQLHLLNYSSVHSFRKTREKDATFTCVMIYNSSGFSTNCRAIILHMFIQ